MSKYWNERRIRRTRDRNIRRREYEDRKAEHAADQYRRRTPGDMRKNARLIFDALGSQMRRMLIERLAREGTMSVSKLIEPFSITLPTGEFHLDILERAGLVSTRKQGRVRLCVFNPDALRELGQFLQTHRLPFD